MAPPTTTEPNDTEHDPNWTLEEISNKSDAEESDDDSDRTSIGSDDDEPDEEEEEDDDDDDEDIKSISAGSSEGEDEEDEEIDFESFTFLDMSTKKKLNCTLDKEHPGTVQSADGKPVSLFDWNLDYARVLIKDGGKVARGIRTDDHCVYVLGPAADRRAVAKIFDVGDKAKPRWSNEIANECLAYIESGTTPKFKGADVFAAVPSTWTDHRKKLYSDKVPVYICTDSCNTILQNSKKRKSRSEAEGNTTTTPDKPSKVAKKDTIATPTVVPKAVLTPSQSPKLSPSPSKIKRKKTQSTLAVTSKPSPAPVELAPKKAEPPPPKSAPPAAAEPKFTKEEVAVLRKLAQTTAVVLVDKLLRFIDHEP